MLILLVDERGPCKGALYGAVVYQRWTLGESIVVWR